MKTFITGKDAALEDSINKMQNGLKELGFNIEEASWLNPVPHVWSVHLRDKDCPMCFTNGKGSTKKAALASALGEYYERLANNYFFADWYLGQKHASGEFVHYPNERWFPASDVWPDDLLDDHCRNIFDEQSEIPHGDLYDRNSGNPSKGVCALPYVRQSDKQTIYIPVNIIGNLYVSNGMSAGNTASEARVQAFSEIFERYAKNKIISEGIAMPDIPKDVLARYPLVLEAVAKLREHGFPVLLKDASLGGRFPVINVTLINPEDGGVFPSFGAHPQFGVALERTLTELLQGRSLDQLDVFEQPSLDLDEVGSTHNLEEHFTDSNGLVHWNFFSETPDYEFSDWNFSGETEDEFQHLLKIFHDMGREVYIADHEHLGVYSCRIHVPGMSEIYPFEDLKWCNNNEGTHLRQILLNLSDVSKEEIGKVYDELVEQAHSDDLPISEFIGVVGDKGSLWSDFRMGELKARMALSLGLKQEATEHIRFVTNFVKHSGDLEKTFRCLESLLSMEEAEVSSAPFVASLKLMYGESVVDRSYAMLAGEDTFFGLPQADDKLEGFKMHTALIEAYQKLQDAKSKHFAV
jgi:ribosomal protein S12 methylthiotransferase accessory factor